MATEASGTEVREFTAGLRSLLEWLNVPGQGAGNEVVALVQETLGSAGREQSVVARELPPFEHVNLQTALAELARDLQPAVVVLEDVDLVAMDRSFGPGGSPVLFDLLDAMDGAAPDADLLFVLTTNRADLLEPALAARPGRIDVAVDVDLPDAAARRRLLELYGRDVPLRLSEDDVTAAVDRTEGVTASFLEELLRRAVLEALHEQDPVSEVPSEHLTRALDDLLDSTQQVTRTLLGAPAHGREPVRVLGRGRRGGPAITGGSGTG